MHSQPAAEQRYQPVVTILVAVLAGVTWDRFLAGSLTAWWILAPSSLAGWWLLGRRGLVRLSGLLLLLAVFSLAALWHQTRWRLFRHDDLGLSARVLGSPVCVEVTARSSPRYQNAPPPDPLNTMRLTDESRLAVEVLRVRRGRFWESASGSAILGVKGRLTGIHAGDRLLVLALLSSPSPPLNPGEPDFAWYERAERRLCRLNADSPACVHVLQPGSRVGLWYWLNEVRDRGNANLWRYVNPARAGLATAVLLGTREQVDRVRNEDFMTTGTIHLLSISGLHVGILAYGFWLMARVGWLSRKTTLVAAVLFVALYAMLTDARPPVVRSATLIGVMCVARFLGRQAFTFNTLAAAGLVVVGLNPLSFFQAGTQLSFLAVATMACLPRRCWGTIPKDPLDRLIAETRSWPVRIGRRVWAEAAQAVMLSTSIWLVALPLVVYRFHLLSPVATVLNPIVCLPMAIALFAGMGVMICGDVVPPLADLCGWICDTSLWSMEVCIAWALTWRGNHGWLPAPPLWWVMIFYAVSAMWFGVGGAALRPPRRWMVAITVAWFAGGSWLMVGQRVRSPWSAPSELLCSFVAVGHGTSVLLEFPGGETLLYDAGRLGTAVTGTRSISSVLWSRGITHLDAVVISHADADHYNAIPGILDRFSVGVIYVTPRMFADDSAALATLRQNIEARGIGLRELVAEDQWRSREGAALTVLHPPPRGIRGSDNANSIVLLVEFGGSRILLPGDLEPPGLQDLLAESRLDCDVIMAPHHGSARSNPTGFAAWSTPETVIICDGFGHDPRATKRPYQTTGARVFHTAEEGMVQVRVQQGKCVVSSFRRRVPRNETESMIPSAPFTTVSSRDSKGWHAQSASDGRGEAALASPTTPIAGALGVPHAPKL